MPEQLKGTFPNRLTRAGAYLAEQLNAYRFPVISPFDFFDLIQTMYAEKDRRSLYLRDPEPTSDTYDRLRLNLRKSNIIAPDKDYKSRLFRIIDNPDLPAADIVSLADPTCHISHLSAMQRWGLTERVSKSLIFTRPDRARAKVMLAGIMQDLIHETYTGTPYPLKLITHPETVRSQSITIHEAKGFRDAWIPQRGTQARLSNIGQTFLDMLQKPDYCGGMAHILDVWEEHALNYTNEIIEAVDEASGALTKSRAGYILQERLGLNDQRIEAWKAFNQRGSSRKLDPSAPFSSVFSETWMISLNA